MATASISWSWDVLRIIGGNQLDSLLRVTAAQPAGDVVLTVLYVTAAVASVWWAGRRLWRMKKARSR